jgi:uncharacterized protein YigE (DUF2233 family)
MQRILFLLGCLFGLSTLQATWTLGERTDFGPLPAGASAWQVQVSGTIGSVRLSGVSFSSARATLRVVDNPPEAFGSFPDLLAATGAFAGMNGGYFHPDYRPLGLMISDGRTIHGFEKSKLLTGVVTVRGGRLGITRAGGYAPGRDVTEALQAGPWLVEAGGVVPGLNAVKRARRSVLATDGKGRWALVACGPLTLAETAAVLRLPGLCGDWTVREALNFDGGSSTALWAATAPKPLVIPSFGPVRNYLAIIPRAR